MIEHTQNFSKTDQEELPRFNWLSSWLKSLVKSHWPLARNFILLLLSNYKTLSHTFKFYNLVHLFKDRKPTYYTHMGTLSWFKYLWSQVITILIFKERAGLILRGYFERTRNNCDKWKAEIKYQSTEMQKESISVTPVRTILFPPPPPKRNPHTQRKVDTI